MQRGQIVLVDTNIIIEAVRTRSWNALTSSFTLETVGKCLEEARTGDPMRRDYVPVDDKALGGLSKVNPVTPLELMSLAVALTTADELDAGERELFAHALRRKDAWIATCADRAALLAAFKLGWMERMVSLESLVHFAGARPDLKPHFGERWLSEVRTAFLLQGGLN